MPTRLSAPRVIDLNIYPEAVMAETEKAAENTQFTLGDLHGNALKLLNFLIIEKAIQIAPENYLSFSDYYKRSLSGPEFSAPPISLGLEDLIEINRIIVGITPAENAHAFFRLIGDVLADRGANDYLTFLLLNRVIELGIKMEILLSNHDLSYIASRQGLKSLGGALSLLWPIIDPATSACSLAKLIKRFPLAEAIEDRIYKGCYTKLLKLISYTLEENEIVVYSHAPISIKLIQSLARYFKVEHEQSTPQELSKTIDAINDQFHQTQVRENSIKAPEGLGSGFFDPRAIDLERDPIAYLTWNRCDQSGPSDLPYALVFVHGHVGNGFEGSQHIINLDANNVLGCSLEFTVGEYCSLRAQGVSRMLESVKENQAVAAKYDDIVLIDALEQKRLRLADTAPPTPAIKARYGGERAPSFFCGWVGSPPSVISEREKTEGEYGSQDYSLY